MRGGTRRRYRGLLCLLRVVNTSYSRKYYKRFVVFSTKGTRGLTMGTISRIVAGSTYRSNQGGYSTSYYRRSRRYRNGRSSA